MGRERPGHARGAVPGLKRTMARRQPSSVLSICMSRILDTSSVSTLRRTRHRGPSQAVASPGTPAASPEDSLGKRRGRRAQPRAAGPNRGAAWPGPDVPRAPRVGPPGDGRLPFLFQEGRQVGFTRKGPVTAAPRGARDPDAAGRGRRHGSPRLEAGPWRTVPTPLLWVPRTWPPLLPPSCLRGLRFQTKPHHLSQGGAPTQPQLAQPLRAAGSWVPGCVRSPTSSACSLAPRTRRPCPRSGKWLARLGHRGPRTVAWEEPGCSPQGAGEPPRVCGLERGRSQGASGTEWEGTGAYTPHHLCCGRRGPEAGVTRSIRSKGKEEQIPSDAALGPLGVQPHASVAVTSLAAVTQNWRLGARLGLHS